MRPPYFSIVIPTKNRPEMVYDSIASALRQDFEDMEVIVSDNYNDERTKATVDKFTSNAKLRYLRTDRELNMLDHWEWATSHAQGQYVIVLPDRKLLIKGALKKLYRFLHDMHHDSIQCASYAIKVYDELDKKMGWYVAHPVTKMYHTSDLIHNFISENYYTAGTLDNIFPKTLNSCYKNSYATAIRARYGQYFNTPGCTTPDYSSFFINAALNDTIWHIGEHIILSQGEAISNGRNFGKGKFQAYLTALNLTEDELYRHVPLRLPFIYNWLIADLLNIKDKIGARLAAVIPDWDNYYYVNQWEYDYKKSHQILAGELVKEFGTQLHQKAIIHRADAISYYENRKSSESTFRTRDKQDNMKFAMKLKSHIRDFLSHRFSHITIVNKIVKHRFDTALQAAGWRDSKAARTHE